MCPAFHREQTTAMNILEVTERKFVSGFRTSGMGLIDPEMPLCIFSEVVSPNELILFRRPRTMIGPCISLINDNASLSDQFFGISERVFV